MVSRIDVAHQPVMLHDAVANLIHNPNGTYIDATFGNGGHSNEILNALNSKGKLIAIDTDDAVKINESFKQDKRFSFYHANFAQIDAIVTNEKISAVDGVLMDLGMSSMQVDNPARGFSFTYAGPLDMRMDTSTGIPLAKKLEKVSEKNLVEIIKQYSDEKNAKHIAKKIITLRKEGNLNSTADLAQTCGSYQGGIHPATRLFMALRIWVNEELTNLEIALKKIAKLLVTGGRLVVISFHSLEDRIVKKFIGPKHNNPGPLNIFSKAQKPSAHEININPRARSAILRTAYKV